MPEKQAFTATPTMMGAVGSTATASGQGAIGTQIAADGTVVTPMMQTLGITGERYATQGDPNAPITVVEFSDYG